MLRNKQTLKEKEYRRFRTQESWYSMDYDELHNFETEEYESEEFLVLPNKDYVPINDMDIYEEISKKILFLPLRNSLSSPKDYRTWVNHYKNNRRFTRWNGGRYEEFFENTPKYKEIQSRSLKVLSSMGYNYYLEMDLTKMNSEERKKFEKCLYVYKEKTYSLNGPKYKYVTCLKDDIHFIVERTTITKTNKYCLGEKPGFLFQKMGGNYEWHKYYKEQNKHYGRDIDEPWTYAKHQPDFKSKKHNKNKDNAWLRTDVDIDEWDKNEIYWRHWEEEYNQQNDNLYDDWLEYKEKQENPDYVDAISKDGYFY